MPEGTRTGSRHARLLPVTMPGPPAAALGEWHSRGLCAGEDPEVFFPSHGHPGTEARQVCAACRVRSDCRDYATAADEFGIWGGLDQQERRNLKRRRQRKKAAAQAGDSHAGGQP
jgi:WhiB family redox-sensing transcriptional regulator